MNDTSKRFVVWVICETAHEWIEYVKSASADTLEEATAIGQKGGGCWGVRLNTSPKPSLISQDDGLWL